MENYDEWRTRTSRDQFEESTDWVHLDYAECIRGVLAGVDDARGLLKRSWTFLTRHWSDEERLWYEPASHIGNGTIRAAYHTVMAFESADEGSVLLTPAPLQKSHTNPLGHLVRVYVDRRRGNGLIIEGSETTVPVRLPTALFQLAVALTDRPTGGAQSELASVLGIHPTSIPTYVSRLNQRIVAGTRGQVCDIISRSVDFPEGHLVCFI